jgi:hypothetical protein
MGYRIRQRLDALGGVAGVARRREIGRIIAVTGNDVIDGIGLTAAIETAIREEEQDRASHMLRDTHQPIQFLGIKGVATSAIRDPAGR